LVKGIIGLRVVSFCFNLPDDLNSHLRPFAITQLMLAIVQSLDEAFMYLRHLLVALSLGHTIFS
jgi:hypothetical protein